MSTHAEIFSGEREYLLGLAYRMLGSIAEAEDMVQETYLRWQKQRLAQIVSPRAWLTTACTRLCLDQLKSSRHQREQYYGQWLPEPMVDRQPDRLEVDESLSMALLHLVERLNPSERAAFLLHDVFAYSFAEVAEVLELRVDHCRQLASRARKRLKSTEARQEVDQLVLRRLCRGFFETIQTGNVQGLHKIFAEEVVLRSDGGGKATAAYTPIVGAKAVVDFLESVFSDKDKAAQYSWQIIRFNGMAGLVLYEDENPVTAFSFEVVGEEITTIFAQRNPDKLASFVYAN